jgi:hypothetical protein
MVTTQLIITLQIRLTSTTDNNTVNNIANNTNNTTNETVSYTDNINYTIYDPYTTNNIGYITNQL